MKKLIRKIGFGSLMLTATMNASLAASSTASTSVTGNLDDKICELIANMSGVFSTLRTLAFVGAAFIIAGWAWGYITKPADLKIEDVKTKGIGMLVGFILLFSVGLLLSIFMSTSGPCADAIRGFGTGL